MRCNFKALIAYALQADRHTGVCEMNTLFDSGVYKIGQQFCLKRVLAIGTRFKGHGYIQSA
jgi:hypothetical protein